MSKELELTWVEIDKTALTHNMREFRRIVGDGTVLCPCVKANAYGHGLVEAGRIFIEAGADWLCVNSIYEAQTLREAGVKEPIYVIGYTSLDNLEQAIDLKLRLIVYNKETVQKLGEILQNRIGKAGYEEREEIKLHLKVETGNNRQGVHLEDLVDFAIEIAKYPGLELEGIATHFANIEDTTDHSYAEKQLEKFKQADRILKEAGFDLKANNCANSAATILFKKTHMAVVRVGISSYGMWPSNETYVSYLKEIGGEFSLKPAFTWKAKIAQIKEINAGEFVGYGCTFKTSHKTKLAIIPIGYSDGYDRCVNGAYVLINGKRAAVRGRVCMNIIMVDVTDIPEVKLEDEVVLIGKDGEEEISCETFASWAGTINYEIPTRVSCKIPRIIV